MNFFRRGSEKKEFDNDMKDGRRHLDQLKTQHVNVGGFAYPAELPPELRDVYDVGQQRGSKHISGRSKPQQTGAPAPAPATLNLPAAPLRQASQPSALPLGTQPKAAERGAAKAAAAAKYEAAVAAAKADAGLPPATQHGRTELGGRSAPLADLAGLAGAPPGAMLGDTSRPAKVNINLADLQLPDNKTAKVVAGVAAVASAEEAIAKATAALAAVEAKRKSGNGAAGARRSSNELGSHGASAPPLDIPTRQKLLAAGLDLNDDGSGVGISNGSGSGISPMHSRGLSVGSAGALTSGRDDDEETVIEPDDSVSNVGVRPYQIRAATNGIGGAPAAAMLSGVAIPPPPQRLPSVNEHKDHEPSIWSQEERVLGRTRVGEHIDELRALLRKRQLAGARRGSPSREAYIGQGSGLRMTDQEASSGRLTRTPHQNASSERLIRIP